MHAGGADCRVSGLLMNFFYLNSYAHLHIAQRSDDSISAWAQIFRISISISISNLNLNFESKIHIWIEVLAIFSHSIFCFHPSRHKFSHCASKHANFVCDFFSRWRKLCGPTTSTFTSASANKNNTWKPTTANDPRSSPNSAATPKCREPRTAPTATSKYPNTTAAAAAVPSSPGPTPRPEPSTTAIPAWAPWWPATAGSPPRHPGWVSRWGNGMCAARGVSRRRPCRSPWWVVAVAIRRWLRWFQRLRPHRRWWLRRRRRLSWRRISNRIGHRGGMWSRGRSGTAGRGVGRLGLPHCRDGRRRGRSFLSRRRGTVVSAETG